MNRACLFIPALLVMSTASIRSMSAQDAAYATEPGRIDAFQTFLPTESGDGSGMQPAPSKQRHRRIRRDPYNADGSLKYTFLGGGGFTLPTGQTADSYATGFRFQGGAGRNFNRRLGLLAQFDWDGLSVRNDVLGKLLPVYQTACGTVCTGSIVAEIFGSSHVWSFTVDPVITVAGGLRRNAYVVTGVGFFHKYTMFSAPAAVSSGSGGAQSPTTQKIDSYTSNAPGFSIGAGVTQQIASSDARFYAEVRFAYVNNQPRPATPRLWAMGSTPFPQGASPPICCPLPLASVSERFP